MKSRPMMIGGVATYVIDPKELENLESRRCSYPQSLHVFSQDYLERQFGGLARDYGWSGQFWTPPEEAD